MIGGTHSGVGKTTLTTGLLAALRARGLKVSSAKVGPDFIDPGYHSVASGRPSRSLDAWLSGESQIPALAANAGERSDVLVIEGVMGLFDGASFGDVDGSTAALARSLDAPVILVVDASAMSTSVAALVHGFATFDPKVRLAGVVLNRVGSLGHAILLREALAPLGIEVVGTLFEDDALVWRERHLGLVPVVERREEVFASIERLGAFVEANVDVAALMEIARRAVRVSTPVLPAAQFVARVRVGVFGGPAFSFIYPDNLERFEQAGAEIVPCDPLVDSGLPEDLDALYLAGGFPEVYAETLSENVALRRDVRERVRGGLVTWAECGGYMMLGDSLDGRPMAGVIEGLRVTMTDRLTLGYREVITRQASFLGPIGTSVRTHEFHYSNATPSGEALAVRSRMGESQSGYASPTLLASYQHQHLATSPHVAEAFVRAAHRHRS